MGVRLLLLVMLIVIDQASKTLMESSSFFVLNTGVAFGLFKDAGYILIVISVLASLFFGFMMHRSKGLDGYLWTMLLAGTIGNLIDRVVIGAVRDFISIGSWFPIFNLADVYLSAGVALLILYDIPPVKRFIDGRIAVRSR